MRLFTAVELGEEVLARAAAFLEDLRARASRMAPRARIAWVPADRMHLTLRFIGEVDGDRAEHVVHALRAPAALAPFVVRWGAPGAFPPRGAPRVLWLGVAHGASDLEALEAEVSRRLEAIGIAPGDRPYRPHLTLARVRDPGGLRIGALLGGPAPALGDTRVEAITLFESRLSPEGSAYLALQRTPLRA
jgi:2'-5' RNA ligase